MNGWWKNEAWKGNLNITIPWQYHSYFPVKMAHNSTWSSVSHHFVIALEQHLGSRNGIMDVTRQHFQLHTESDPMQRTFQQYTNTFTDSDFTTFPTHLPSTFADYTVLEIGNHSRTRAAIKSKLPTLPSHLALRISTSHPTLCVANLVSVGLPDIVPDFACR
jgi:hypothetical protein